MSAKWLFTFKHFKFPLLPLLTHSALIWAEQKNQALIHCYALAQNMKNTNAQKMLVKSMSIGVCAMTNVK